MLLLAISVFIASVIILVSMKLRKKNNFPETINKELIKYFSEAYFASVNVKKAQLLKAAKYLIEVSEDIKYKQEKADVLYKQGLLSDDYMDLINKRMENEIFVEKCLIQREAEELKVGFGDIIFSEANTLPSIYKKEKNYKSTIVWKKLL